MPIIYTDVQIDSLINEHKSLPVNWESQIHLQPQRGHSERQMELVGVEENKFRLILRKSEINPLDFSLILAIHVPQSSQLFRLRRYNGKSHEHTNHIEDETFYDFHIHVATERYQDLGTREDAYAVTTSHYDDYSSAFHYLISDANLIVPPDEQRDFFE